MSQTDDLAGGVDRAAPRSGMVPITNTVACSVAAEAGFDVEEALRLRELSRSRSVLSLDEPAGADGTDTYPLSAVLASETRTEHEAERASRIAWVRTLLLSLTERERTVLRPYYAEERTLVEISRALGLSPGRISQIRSQAIAKLTPRVVPERTRRVERARRNSPGGS